MADAKIQKYKSITFLTLLSVISALIVLWNEWMSIRNRVPGGNYPIEHQSSWARVIIFCGVALISLLALWFFRKREVALRLPLVFVFFLTLLLVLAGLINSHYLSLAGWCCETPCAFHFGYPFSSILAYTACNPTGLQVAQLNLFDVLNQPSWVFGWDVRLLPSFLNFLFWFNVILLVDIASASFLLVKRGHPFGAVWVQKE
jgi:hypothetical protein